MACSQSIITLISQPPHYRWPGECRQLRDAIHDTFSPSAKTEQQHFCSNNLAGPVGISPVLLINQSSPGLYEVISLKIKIKN